MHAIAWRNPMMVREQLKATAEEVGGKESRRAYVTRALQSALSQRTTNRSELALETVREILDDDYDLSLISLEPLYRRRKSNPCFRARS